VRCVPIRKPKPDAENKWGLIGISRRWSACPPAAGRGTHPAGVGGE